jgi:hypothetical protein
METWEDKVPNDVMDIIGIKIVNPAIIAGDLDTVKMFGYFLDALSLNGSWLSDSPEAMAIRLGDLDMLKYMIEILREMDRIGNENRLGGFGCR